MCRCTAFIRTPCCGSIKCHEGIKECSWHTLSESYSTIDEDEVARWTAPGLLSGSSAISYLTELLNGSYSLEAAREDILSFREV